MKFKYKINPVLFYLIVIAITYLFVSALYLFLRLFNIFNDRTTSIALDIIVIILYLFFAILLSVLLQLKYKLKNDILSVNLIFNISVFKLSVNDIISIINDRTVDRLYINSTYKDQPRVVLIDIEKCDYDRFVTALREINPQILYEVNDIKN